ncbi:cell division ATP-binding protein FtsE [Gardnerella pickettii]|uniref:Cell division ATP-binding protein FtsE n=1 Tax=Gardnerella pickettii JCP7719 TaxID=1261061 RepID=S4GKG7_9BIFI|nr:MULTISPECIES: cell division ATP-binding protein FtsE [Gardnerella]EPI49838.1 cell division ATP-binding protein FtsE [Gardnerella pickettii JCP7719]MDK7188940.1 cell division ATP-binding protein FtsE [Bifidobacterium sp. UMB1230]PMC45220.1 cell division ATP-binding protein FtsE [Peptoniphilus lacrimalis]RDW96781.1 cell division protein FtsE [Gardnerella vaginalis]
MSLISLEHVSKIYPKGTRPALDDISLDVNRGDFVFLVGASGSGKTTLLSLLLREEEATKGEIHVAGNDLRRLVNRQVPQYRRSLGFIFQDYKLLNNKTVYQNVAFALEVIGTSRSTIKSLVPRVLETVGLTGKENNYPHELSGGEAQRVAIARAYVNHPQILLADEPTGNLDPTTSLGIMEVLDAINRTGTTIVMATHNEEIVNSMRKRVVELHSGHIVRDEREGSYDSALYFPDADVEQKSKAQQAVEGDSISAAVADSKGDSKSESNGGSNGESSSNANSQSPINANGFDESQENYRFMSKRAKRAVQAKKAMDAVAQTLQNGSDSNEGIARLAQSVHSGRTGRYGEVFQPLETTMTWGRGLSIPPAPPAKKLEDKGDASSVDESNETSSNSKASDSEANKTEINKTEVNKSEANKTEVNNSENLKNEGDE